MALARAFTTRRNKPDEIHITSPLYVGRAMSQRGGRPVIRAQISAPIALVSTTNVQLNGAHNIADAAPIDVRSVSPVSNASSFGEDSDESTSVSLDSHDTVTDASSVEGSSPVGSELEPNHLSCYFKPAVDTRGKSRSQSPTLSAQPSFDSPHIPQRVPSHSKRAHEVVHRRNSLRRMMSPPPPGRGSEIRGSAEIFSPTPLTFAEPSAPHHPFDKELQQLDEVAEEFGHVFNRADADAETRYMRKHGLACFSANDYMLELQSLLAQTFSDAPVIVLPDSAGWI